MKSVFIFQDFAVSFSDCEGKLNNNNVKKWFDTSRHNTRVSRTTYYDFLHILKHYTIEDDGYEFKLDWRKIREDFSSDKDFLKKLEPTKKGRA